MTDRNIWMKAIREACIKENPKKIWERPCPCGCVIDIIESITLADVLTALRPTHGSLAVDKDGLFIVPTPNNKWGWNVADPSYPVWNIYEDDLGKQSDDCLQFIANVVSST